MWQWPFQSQVFITPGIWAALPIVNFANFISKSTPYSQSFPITSHTAKGASSEESEGDYVPRLKPLRATYRLVKVI